MNTNLGLRALLLLLVGGPLFVLLLIETLVTFGIGLHVTNQVFDRWLLDSAYSLAQEVRQENGELVLYADEAAIEVFEWDELDEVYYRVSTLDGRVLGGETQAWITPSLTALKQGPVFTNIKMGGEWVRSVTVLTNPNTPSESALVSVAETLHKRIPLSRTLMFEVVFSKAIMIVAALLVVALALSKGIRPLLRLSQEIANRSPRDLTPISTQSAPKEVRTVIDNTNQLLERLDDAFNAREQFIGNISHQLKTPLAGIKLQAQLALREKNLESAHQALERICQTTDAMTHLNIQLLKLARAEAASGRGLRNDSVALDNVVREAAESLRELARGRNVTVQQNFSSAPANPIPEIFPSFKVAGDYYLLRELVWNLMENAILYVPEGGNVWVALSRENGKIRLSVKDDGLGIPREHWPVIFERFFRSKISGDGCGLGLAIVREIAFAHGATVELQEAPGTTPGTPDTTPSKPGTTGAYFVCIFPAEENPG
ncbi:sensor histidine kinase [Microbulbifer bruguierae]|uniref:histidine kinase n=1 Tax=Microbulbifer bruguierae TaxID=3029061 RepID=A0ABY8NF91_9GAMM|nr:sensor histidine kinase [Microbulbifer bruguierae]WGL17059.1 sensor histidine kinase [Microbulbifer bruguierae]